MEIEDMNVIIQEQIINSLKQQINSNKIFLNMIIHDMRNPTTSL
jgi:hypothetical protein